MTYLDDKNFRKRIAIAGQIFSENLGDGAIMACAEHLLIKHPNVLAIERVDLQGRSNRRVSRKYDPSFWVRTHRYLYSKSGSYGSLVNWVRFSKNRAKLIAKWRPIIARSNAVVIGGGQLLQHSRLQFPLCLCEIVKICESERKPVIYWGVGVGDKWTHTSRRLLGQALLSPIVQKINVRDTLSSKRLLAQFPELSNKLETSYDLAVCVSKYFPSSQTERNVVGVAPLSPFAISRVLDGCPLSSMEIALKFWSTICRQLSKTGAQVKLFTTGTNEDLDFAKMVQRKCVGVVINDIVHPTEVDELCKTISGFSAAITGRLHASIIAWSYHIPFQGLLWDHKVEGFSKSVSAESCFFEGRRSPESIVSSLIENNMILDLKSPRLSIKKLVGQIVNEFSEKLPTSL